MMEAVTAPAIGAYSEVGTPHTAIVRRPDLAHARLPPRNCHELVTALLSRDTSARIDGGVSLNRMYWPARRHESLPVEAVYRLHPRLRQADFKLWYGGFDHDGGTASIEGGETTGSCRDRAPSDRRSGARPWSRRRPLHDLPGRPRSLKEGANAHDR